MMVVRSDNAWATQINVIPPQGGSLQTVVGYDAQTGTRAGEAGVQDDRQQTLFNEELEREKAAQAGFPTKPAKSSKSTKGVKSGKKAKAR